MPFVHAPLDAAPFDASGCAQCEGLSSSTPPERSASAIHARRDRPAAATARCRARTKTRKEASFMLPHDAGSKIRMYSIINTELREMYNNAGFQSLGGKCCPRNRKWPFPLLDTAMHQASSPPR